MNFPRELRQIIYDMSIIPDGTVNFTAHCIDPESPHLWTLKRDHSTLWINGFEKGELFLTALSTLRNVVHTSKQVAEDASDYFFMGSVFKITMSMMRVSKRDTSPALPLKIVGRLQATIVSFTITYTALLGGSNHVKDNPELAISAQPGENTVTWISSPTTTTNATYGETEQLRRVEHDVMRAAEEMVERHGWNERALFGILKVMWACARNGAISA